MYAVVITDEGGVQRRLDFSKPELTVGRVNGNDIVLAKRNVSKQHARLSLENEKAVVVDLNSTNGTWVNGRKITSPHPLKSGDKIYIADFIITLESDAAAEDAAPANHVSEPPPMPAKSSSPGRSPKPIRSSMPSRSSMPIKGSMPARKRTARPKEALQTSLPPRIESRPTDEAELAKGRVATDPLEGLMLRLADRIDLEEVNPDAMKDQERWSAARAAIAETFLAMQNDGSVNADVDMRQIAHTALHEAVGLGALDDVLSNEAVEMIVVQSASRILIDTGDGLRPTALSFSSTHALRTVARRLAAQSGRPLGDTASFHGRLSFGPRVSILQPPLATTGPVIEIEVGRPAALDKLAEDGWMSEAAATYLTKALAECRNILVVGAQGSGSDRLLAAMARELPTEENTVVIEAVPILDLDRSNVVSLTANDAQLSMVEAIGHGTRLRADHLVINDLTGADVVSALSVISGREPGHLLGVQHAASGNPIEGLLLQASCHGTGRPCASQLLGTTIDLVVAMERKTEGKRLTAILEVRGHEAGDVSFESVSV